MNRIITVSREFGSGGRELGKRLADALEFSYFDREIVTALAEKTGLDEDFLASSTESGAFTQIPIHFARSFSEAPAFSNEAVKLMSMQTSLIKELASKGNCVIVGRAADSILEEFRPFRIFVYADEASKLARCRSRAGDGEDLTDREMLRAMKRIDNARAEFTTSYPNINGEIKKDMISASIPPVLRLRRLFLLWQSMSGFFQDNKVPFSEKQKHPCRLTGVFNNALKSFQSVT